jgi:outer membrane protein OmpA-like peptidoglycan-associated protein
MKISRLFSFMLASSVLMLGCSSTPKTNSELEQARSDYISAQTNPTVTANAPMELKQASDALNIANRAWEDRESSDKVSQLAYIAKQKVAISQQVAQQKVAEIEVAEAAKQRDQARLDQRTAEADSAKHAANVAEFQTKIAQGDAAEAQRRAQDAQARAAQLEAALSDLAAKKTDRGLVVTLGDVFFGTNKSELKPDGYRNVQKLADVLKQNPQRTVLIEGYTDSSGSASHNQDLSERRADSVRSALVRMGVAPDRIKTQGYGEEKPVASNDTAANRQLNRRVEVVLSDENGKTTSTGGY